MKTLAHPLLRATAVALLVACAATPALAQRARGKAAPPPEWDVNLGVAAMLRPTFDGSDRYRVRPLPFVTVKWRDAISFGEGGLSAYWHRGPFRIGGGLTFDPGREERDTGGIFANGDDRLAGLGKIDFSLGLRGFASYRVGFVDFSVSATKYTGDQNDGVLATLGASAPLPLGKRLVVIPNIRATWTDGKYSQAYFGVTPLQASRSRFARFTAGSGLQDVSAGVNVIYRFNSHWFAGANASVTRLTGDAAASPISIADTNASVMTMLGYHF